VGIKDLQDGKFTFDSIVQLYKDSIRDKGKLSTADLEDWVDQCPTAAEDIMAEINAFKALSAEAKKVDSDPFIFILGFAYGNIHISPINIDDWAMSDLWIAYLGYWKNENLRSRVSWETSRYVSFVTLKSAGDKRLKKPTDLMRFLGRK